MATVNFTDRSVSYNPNAFYQYDFGQKIELTGLKFEDDTTVEVHIAKKGQTATVIETTVNDSATSVDIPNDMLINSGILNIYIYSKNQESGKTCYSVDFQVRAREKPENFDEEQIAALKAANMPEGTIEDRLSYLEDAVKKTILNDLGVL